MRRSLGVILIGLSIVSFLAFLINLGLGNAWHLPSLIISISSWQWLWNPLSYFTPLVTGGIPLVGGLLNSGLNFVVAVIYSGILFGLGLILAK